MGSDRGSGGFALGLAIRAAIIGALTLLVLELVFRRQLYATAFVTSALAGVVAFDLWRRISRADAMLENFLDSLSADAFERPARPPRGFGRFGRALERALTGLRKARETRQGSIDHLQGLLDTVAAALLVVEADGTLVLANRAAQRLAGRAVRRMEDIAELGEAAADLSSLGPGGRKIIQLADGRQVLATVAAFTAADVRARRLISLQSIAGELDAVEQKAWRDLVRILSHEMMNSLTPIVSLSESLQGRVTGDDDVADTVEVIARRSAGLMSFVDRYRKMADLPDVAPAPIRLADFVADIGRLMGSDFAKAGVAYTSSVEPADLSVFGDRELLEQAVINLLKNAGDAVRGCDAPAVALACRIEEGRVIIAVEDNGAGIPSQKRDEIFIPFYSTKADGSGVGLTLARQVALAHAGQLEFRPGPAGGSIFRLSLPVAG